MKSKNSSSPLRKQQSLTSISIKEASPFSVLPSDCIFYILDYCGKIVINLQLGIEEITDSSAINWKVFLKKWYGKFKSDGNVRFLFRNGIVKDCKKNTSLEQVKFLLRQMKIVNSPNVRYWDIQIVNQITKISEKKMVPQLRYEVDTRYSFKDKSVTTKEMKIEKMYLNRMISNIQNLSNATTDNQLVFNSIKYVDLKEVPKNLELVKPLLNLFPNMEYLKLMDIFCFSLENGRFISPFGKCTKLEIEMKYVTRFSFRNIVYFPNLEHLTFTQNLTVGNAQILKELKHLKTLILKCNVDDLEGFDNEVIPVISEFPKLETLHIENAVCFYESIVALSKSPTLKILKLETSWPLEPEYYFEFQGFPKLESFSLSGYIPLALARFSMLTSLELNSCFYCDDWEGLRLLTELTSLTLCCEIDGANGFCGLISNLQIREELLVLKKLSNISFKILGNEVENERQIAELFEENMYAFIQWLTSNLENCKEIKLSSWYNWYSRLPAAEFSFNPFEYYKSATL